jgi:hypothetical protein
MNEHGDKAQTPKQHVFTTTAARKRWFILLQLAADGEDVIIVEPDKNQRFKLMLVGKAKEETSV